jgi:uncharacterized protein YoxC
VDQDNVDAMTAEILQVVMILLEDVSDKNGRRVDRAIAIAERDISAIVRQYCQSGRRKGPRA